MILLIVTECFLQLFGWDLVSLHLIAHQKRCQAFLLAGKPDEALEAHKQMMDAIDESAKASCLDWSNDSRKDVVRRSLNRIWRSWGKMAMTWNLISSTECLNILESPNPDLNNTLDASKDSGSL
ncbi:hypothetical protein BDR07DRAFT_1422359 [Suillus spraguei]|nr:hypothetical protein BDR07DRAFT_1422359 [Suillus spraguei]